jgi:hypothetical protein
MLTVQKDWTEAYDRRSDPAVCCDRDKHLIERCVATQGQAKLKSDFMSKQLCTGGNERFCAQYTFSLRLIVNWGN